MIFGILTNDNWDKKAISQSGLGCDSLKEDGQELYCDDEFSLIFNRLKINNLQKKKKLIYNDSQYLVLCFGNIFNYKDLANQLGASKQFEDDSNPAELASACFKKWQTGSFVKLNGNYILVIWDKRKKELIIARDHLGIESVFYSWKNQKLIFSTSLIQLSNHSDIKKNLNYRTLYTYLLFNYNPGNSTFLQNVRKLPAGHYLKISNQSLEIKRFWYLSFEKVSLYNHENDYAKKMFRLFKDAVSIRVAEKEKTHGAFLSGGMDSSSVVGLLSDLSVNPIHTFSFRCKGKTFDESEYAQIMADSYKTIHHLVEYPASAISVIEDMVSYMEEPFSDIGIEIATYILGKEAHGKTNYVFTGDGGDELFAGHPVYLADNIACMFDRIPNFIRKPLIRLLQYLPDTNKKKSIIVKMKRFSYSYQFAADLYSNRWRVYYLPNEIRRLLSLNLYEELKEFSPLLSIAKIYDDANGQDFMSKAIYGDYLTVVGFYFARMKLLRKFGIESRFPMFDYRFVEFAAKMPNILKINGSKEKYLLHKAMTGFLPDEIVFRKDKLGHSVPMKNWIRDEKIVKEFVNDHLLDISNNTVLFNTKYINKLIFQHMAKTHNHSHRLWALIVLHLWMQKNKF
ncbi:MAG: hypothetical protein HUN04_14130 [Desulfobacter sp.]|nr:MAG: hypothetical protein HUN04_14130 [Desulfobacter sp.]